MRAHANGWGAFGGGSPPHSPLQWCLDRRPRGGLRLTKVVGPAAYQRLCATADRTDAVVRIFRQEGAWVLTVKTDARGGPMAVGLWLPDLGDLDRQATWLEGWLTTVHHHLDSAA